VPSGRVTATQPFRSASSPPPPWLLGFLALHLGCQLLLLVPWLSAGRVFIRMAAFGASLLLLFVVPRNRAAYAPTRTLAIAVVTLLTFELLHPDTSMVAGVAAVALNFAILGPIFWVPSTNVTMATFQRLVTVLWLFYTASAVLGVLQSYFPGHFQPPLSSIIAGHGRGQVLSLQIRLASGERVFRPMGLTDIPGGAAYGGLYAILLGTGIVLLPKPPFSGARILAVGGMVAGMMCLYLCQVRSIMVMVGVCTIALLGLLLVSGRGSRLLGLLAAVGVVIPGAFILAVSLGGRAVTDRLSTLVEADPGTVYYAHRGHFLTTTINEYLPQFPLGAGLGRWGMISSYFGSSSGSLWAEIQWTAWLFDGGLPLVLIYFAAVVVASRGCLKVALRRISGDDPALSLWGAVVVAYDVGALALCFNYPVFAGTSGIEFWLLNTALLCAAQDSDRRLLLSRVAV